MPPQRTSRLTRRRFTQVTSSAVVGAALAPFVSCGRISVDAPMTRTFGRLGFDVTTLGLGGQASLQWTADDVDPTAIIAKAYNLGVNYFDTSNLYGQSQANYGKAFRQLGLVPGVPGYDDSARRSIFLTSKTRLRYARGGEGREVGNTNGPAGSRTVDDLRRTLTQVFGNGRGRVAKEAYVDMVLLHAIGSSADVDAVFEGLDAPEGNRVGALAALLDYRDGSNRTGLNPGEEKRIRHIGFSGHRTPRVLMDLMQRDDRGIFDAMLVAVNAHDRTCDSMQLNAIPVATAKKMGVIAMKTFADGAFYGKEPRFSRAPDDVIRTVGHPGFPSRPLVEYGLTTPGVHTAIIGIGHVSLTGRECQLEQNLSAAQIRADALTPGDRHRIEEHALAVAEGKRNYFQRDAEPLTPPRDLALAQDRQNGTRAVSLTWQTAYAGHDAIAGYDIERDGRIVGSVKHQPQTTRKPFAYGDPLKDRGPHAYRVITLDAAGARAASDVMLAEPA